MFLPARLSTVTHSSSNDVVLLLLTSVQAKELEEVQRQLQSELLSAKALYEEQMEAKSGEASRVEEQLKTKYV